MGEVAQWSGSPVDTGKVAGRRVLRFASIDELMAEVERLAGSERAGRLRRLGNWTLGQALGHLATWTEYGYTGVPLKVPFFVKWIMKGRKQKFLNEPMRAGARIPRVKGGTLATDPIPLDDGLERMRRVMQRLKSEPPTKPSPLFGLLTHDESIAMALRHAEMHLGFFVPQ